MSQNVIFIAIRDENGLGATVARLIREDILLNHGKALLKFVQPDGTEEVYTLYPGRNLDEQITHAKLNHYSQRRSN